MGEDPSDDNHGITEFISTGRKVVDLTRENVKSVMCRTDEKDSQSIDLKKT